MTLRPIASTAPAEIAWMHDAACRDYPVAWFFPDDGEGVRDAREVCGGCPVRRACLSYALRYRLNEGVWGGASERQRRRLLARSLDDGDEGLPTEEPHVGEVRT